MTRGAPSKAEPRAVVRARTREKLAAKAKALPPCRHLFTREPRSLGPQMRAAGITGAIAPLLVSCLHHRATQARGHGRGAETSATFLAVEFGLNEDHVRGLLGRLRKDGWLSDDDTFGPRVSIPDGESWLHVRHKDVRRLRVELARAAAQIRKLDKLRGERTVDGLVLSSRHLAALLCRSHESARRWLAELDALGYVRRKVRKGYAAVCSAVAGAGERLAKAVRPSRKPAAPQAAQPELDALPGAETADYAAAILARLGGTAG